MTELVKFTGGNKDLFCRESADNLHAKAQVIVPETHTVLLIKDGVVSEALGAGRHDIFDTENGFFRLKKDSDVASVDFVFVSKTARLPMLWGTSTPMKMRDPITGVPVSVGINGELEFRVKTPKQFYLELVGADTEYSVDKLKARVKSRLLAIIEPNVAETMRTQKISYTDFTENKTRISELLKEKVATVFAAEYGLELCSFTINGAYIPDADIALIEHKRAAFESAAAVTGACPNCGAATVVGAKFCAECGIPLNTRKCECGATVEPNAKFCPECGKKL